MSSLFKFCKKLIEEIDAESEAQHPQTPANRLVALAQHEDPSVRQHVAQNPNTPVKTLKELVTKGHNIDKNPAIAMHGLEDPDFVDTDKKGTTSKILNQVINKLSLDSSDYKTAINLAGNKNLTPDQLEILHRKLGGSTDSSFYHPVHEVLASNPKTPTHLLNNYWEAFNTNKYSPAPHLRTAYVNGRGEDYTDETVDRKPLMTSLATNPVLPKEMSSKMLQHPKLIKNTHTLKALASNPAVDIEDLYNVLESPLLQNERYNDAKEIINKRVENWE